MDVFAGQEILELLMEQATGSSWQVARDFGEAAFRVAPFLYLHLKRAGGKSDAGFVTLLFCANSEEL